MSAPQCIVGVSLHMEEAILTLIFLNQDCRHLLPGETFMLLLLMGFCDEGGETHAQRRGGSGLCQRGTLGTVFSSMTPRSKSILQGIKKKGKSIT